MIGMADIFLSAQIGSYFGGKFLVAMPAMQDAQFVHSLVYLVDHSQEGAMGLIVNKPLKNHNFSRLCSYLDVDIRDPQNIPLVFGGPVEKQRGFVLHSNDYGDAQYCKALPHGLALSATKNVITDLAQGQGPRNAIVAMGFAGWADGQLESEIARNDWLIVDADPALIFSVDHDDKWELALKQSGIDPRLLSTTAGHA
jgi:putative transcriptional regulator